MSATTADLLAAFEALPRREKAEFLTELFRRLPPIDSGPLDDEVAARAGDDLVAILEAEEHAAETR